MATIKFYLDTRKGQSPFPLKISLSHKGNTALISTPYRLSPENWDASGQRVIRHPSKAELNTALLSLRAETEQRIADIPNKASLSAVQIKGLLAGDGTSFEARFKMVMDGCSTAGNRNVYLYTLKRLREYAPNLLSLSFDDIGPDWLKGFDRFLAETERPNSRSIRLRCVRAVFNDAIDNGVTANYPFRKFNMPHEQTRKRSLSEEELKTLFSAVCVDSQAEYRDMFLLMIYLRGINAADLFTARPEQVRGGRLEYRRAKTHKLYSVKIEPEAAAVMERYRGKEHLISPCDRYRSYRDYLHHMNDGLKAIGRPLGKRGKAMGAGLFPDISSYWARHTWATIAARLDIPKDIIARGLGHSFGLGVTEIYIDFDESKVDAANRRVIGYLNAIGISE